MSIHLENNVVKGFCGATEGLYDVCSNSAEQIRDGRPRVISQIYAHVMNAQGHVIRPLASHQPLVVLHPATTGPATLVENNGHALSINSTHSLRVSPAELQDTASSAGIANNFMDIVDCYYNESIVLSFNRVLDAQISCNLLSRIDPLMMQIKTPASRSISQPPTLQPSPFVMGLASGVSAVNIEGVRTIRQENLPASDTFLNIISHYYNKSVGSALYAALSAPSMRIDQVSAGIVAVLDAHVTGDILNRIDFLMTQINDNGLNLPFEHFQEILQIYAAEYQKKPRVIEDTFCLAESVSPVHSMNEVSCYNSNIFSDLNAALLKDNYGFDDLLSRMNSLMMQIDATSFNPLCEDSRKIFQARANAFYAKLQIKISVSRLTSLLRALQLPSVSLASSIGTANTEKHLCAMQQEDLSVTEQLPASVASLVAVGSDEPAALLQLWKQEMGGKVDEEVWNAIKKTTEIFTRLEGVSVLPLQVGRHTSIPDLFKLQCICDRVEVLNISGNSELKSLPDSVLALPKLQEINAKGCPNLKIVLTHSQRARLIIHVDRESQVVVESLRTGS
ncbi:MAG: hypothetical protein P4L16_05555 [Chlamydiales bacterium]|nr:hypothetical protein [Chlamydiales bacterium]